mgnify:CR=1 FL=1
MLTNNKKKLLIGLIILIITVTTTVGFFIHNSYANTYNGVKEEKVNKFEKLFVIFDIIEKSYVEDVGVKPLVTGAIDGMLNALEDPYTVYLPPKEYEGMKKDFEGKYGGIGIMITLRSGRITIVSPFKGTPGSKAGLKAGDIIHKISGKKTKGMQLKEAVDLMRGKPGTEVTLTIKRGLKENVIDPEDQTYKTMQVDITRAEIEVPYVTSELKEGNVGYIELTRFIENSGRKIEEAIAKLNQQGAEGFVLDLRNNPGGLLQEASKVASNFVDQGPVVRVKERGKKKQAIPLARGFNTTDKPLVVLVNGGSASASEIVTGVIKDNERGTVVGSKTFGKGVVQSLLPLTDGSAVKMTTARYYTPSGKFIHHEGIKPDIKVTASETPNNSDLIQTKNAQKVLQAIDYYQGEIDGVYGPATANAVLRFQRENQLEITGVINSKTEKELAKIASRKNVQDKIKSEDRQLKRALEILKKKLQ